jgi:hypothetical protein
MMRREGRALVGLRTCLIALCVVGAASCEAVQSVVAPTPATCAEPNRTSDPNVSSIRCVTFAGFEWKIKLATDAQPGPNGWTDHPGTVWMDGPDLHLRIANRAGRWFSAEVILNRQALGYGRYTFRTRGALDRLDDNVVVGMFLYDFLDPSFSHREIDIEYGKRLGRTPGASGHFTIQPFTTPGNSRDFVPRLSDSIDTHVIDWRPGRVMFESGSEQWTFAGPGIPVPGAENVRINIWVFGGAPPTNGAESEIVFTDFRFEP